MNKILELMRNDPYAGLLGVRLDEVENGRALCSVTVTPDMFNFLGVIHGGMIFSLADVAFAAASNYEHPPSFALDISGSFLKTASVGDVIQAEAALVHTTRRTGVYTIRVSSNGKLMAIFNGTVFRKSRESLGH